MTAKSQARRRPVRAVERVHHENEPRSLTASLIRCATSREAKMAYVAIGAIGLTALAVAIVGPRRIEQQVIRPIRGRVGQEAERLWSESRPLREQFAQLVQSAGSTAGRERLVRSFQSWIGHFRAT
jgi:NAD/NADP transhydrogenase alpha subunit